MEMISLLPSKEQKYVRTVFANCPNEIKKNMRTIEVKKGQNFIDAETACKNVYIILKGKAIGIDIQLQGRVYVFKKFKPGRFLGEFECMGNIPNYTITVQATTDCILLVIAATQYVKWMMCDGNALFLRTQILLHDLTVQLKDDRRFFLSNCKERLFQYLVIYYEKEKKELVCLKMTREDLANEMGFVIRTIDRNINKLSNDGFLSLKTGKIFISKENYLKMKIHLEQNLTYKED